MDWPSNEKQVVPHQFRRTRARANSAGSIGLPTAYHNIGLRPRKSEVPKLRSREAIPTRLRPRRTPERKTRTATASRRELLSWREDPLGFGRNQRDVRDPDRAAQLVVKQAAGGTQQSNQQEVCLRAGCYLHIGIGPGVGARKILCQCIHCVIVIRVDNGKAHATFGGDLFGLHVGMKMVSMTGL